MAWGNNYETPKSKRGMFKGRSLSSLEKEAGHVSGTKSKQVNFAIRAKKAHGGKWKGVTAEGEEMTGTYIKGVRKVLFGKTSQKARDTTVSRMNKTAAVNKASYETHKKAGTMNQYKPVKEETMKTNNYEAMIVAAVEKKPDDFTQAFEAAIQEKLQGHVAGFKEFLQKTLLGDEPIVVEETETVDEGEAVDIDEVFELFLDQHNEGHFANLEEAVIAFAKEVELTEEEAVEYYEYLTSEETEETVDEAWPKVIPGEKGAKKGSKDLAGYTKEQDKQAKTFEKK